jgi:hypothetical protein
MTDLTKLPWYGGNKIPDSYLKKFLSAVEDEGIPYELRLFVDQLGSTSIEPPKQGAYMSSHD